MGAAFLFAGTGAVVYLFTGRGDAGTTPAVQAATEWTATGHPKRIDRPGRTESERPVHVGTDRQNGTVKESERKKDRSPQPPPPLADVHAAQVQQLLDQLNVQRRQEMSDEVTLHAIHSRGCRDHAEYLARHLANHTDLDWHDQDDSLKGATREGQEAARAATVSRSDPAEAMRGWLKAPAHRALLTSPTLMSVGIGMALDRDRKWVLVCDFQRGRRAFERAAGGPVIYPVDGQGNVPLVFPGNEVPDPLPMTKEKLAGYPITVTFHPSVKVPQARAWLEDESGNAVPMWFSSPTRPANDKHTKLQQNTLCLFAKRPLAAGTRYVVRLEARVEDSDWAFTGSFTTQARVEVGTRLLVRAVARVNHYRKAASLPPVSLDLERSQDCLAHARYVVRHLDRGAGAWISDEDPQWEGYTRGGQKVGRRAAIRLGGGSGPADAVDWMMTSVLNRHLVLYPGAKTVAFGAAQHAPRGWVWVYHVPPSDTTLKRPTAYLYPGKGQKNLPVHFGWDIRTLVPTAPADSWPGLPITARFLGARDIRACEATLRDSGGNAVECWVSTPEKPLSSTGSYRQIILLPKKQLKGGTTYTALMSAELDGEKWSEQWTFTTFNPTAYRTNVARELIRRVNAAREVAGLRPVTLDDDISKGCQAHAAYVARNVEHPKVAGLGIHDEDPSLPGYTEAGARAGPRSVIAVISDPLDSVAGWLATLYHRIPVLDPGLKRVGYGQELHPLRGWVTVLDCGSGR